jgi:putative hemolysin
MSEIALISARKNRLESSAKKGNKSAQVALNLANSPNKFLSTSNWNYSYWYPYRYL